MKKSLLLSLLVAASTSISAFAAEKLAIVDLRYSINDGGEFTVLPSGFGNSGYGSSTKNIGQIGTFQTFCVEFNEPIQANKPYDVIPAGGTEMTSQGTDLNKGTAYLYQMFAEGTLAGYSYVGAAARLASASALQQEIWYLMDGIGGPSAFHATVVAAVGAANILLPNAGEYNVKILNLKTIGGKSADGNVQDVLYIPGVPDGGLTLALLGMGLTGVGIISRRSRK